MSGKPAARKGDKTDHEDTTLVPGPAASNTDVNGKPVWRTNADTKTCPLVKPAIHMPEIARFGSYTVLVENEMATRVGDFCVGSVFPATITEGSDDVLIGDTPFGLAARVQAFCKDFCALTEKWDDLTLDERKEALQDVVNKHFDALEIPEVGVDFQSLTEHNYGHFSFSDWKLVLNDKYLGTLSSVEKTQLANTLIHEGRHAEQWWHSAQYAAAQEGATSDGLASTMWIPGDVADEAIANPLNDVFGKTVYQSVYGSGSGYRNATLNELKLSPQPEGSYPRYRALPEEHDAWATGDSLSCDCEKEKKKAEATE